MQQRGFRALLSRLALQSCAPFAHLCQHQPKCHLPDFVHRPDTQTITAQFTIKHKNSEFNPLIRARFKRIPFSNNRDTIVHILKWYKSAISSEARHNKAFTGALLGLIHLLHYQDLALIAAFFACQKRA